MSYLIKIMEYKILYRRETRMHSLILLTAVQIRNKTLRHRSKFGTRNSNADGSAMYHKLLDDVIQV